MHVLNPLQNSLVRSQKSHMTHTERQRLIDQPFPPIDAARRIPGKSWAGCYIRNRDEGRHLSSVRATTDIGDSFDFDTLEELIEFEHWLDSRIVVPRR